MSHAYHVIMTLLLFSLQSSIALGIPTVIVARQSPYIARQFKLLYFLFGISVCLLLMSLGLLFFFQHCPICGFDISHC